MYNHCRDPIELQKKKKKNFYRYDRKMQNPT